jgi:hypothetical protein
MPAFSIWLFQAIIGAIGFSHAAFGPQPLPTPQPTVAPADGSPQREVSDVAMRFFDEKPLEFGGTFTR